MLRLYTLKNFRIVEVRVRECLCRPWRTRLNRRPFFLSIVSPEQMGYVWERASLAGRSFPFPRHGRCSSAVACVRTAGSHIVVTTCSGVGAKYYNHSRIISYHDIIYGSTRKYMCQDLRDSFILYHYSPLCYNCAVKISG